MKKEKAKAVCDALDDFPKLLMELMGKYDFLRGAWFEKFGNYNGFDTWFMGQLFKKENAHV